MFSKQALSRTDSTNFTTVRFIIGMFSRTFFTRLQEKNLQVSVSGKAALSLGNWLAFYLMDRVANFPSLLWPLGS